MSLDGGSNSAQKAGDKTAMRIKGRAIRRAGELLKAIETPKGRASAPAPEKPTGGGRLLQTREDIAKATGLSVRQQKDAINVASIPKRDFEKAIEANCARSPDEHRAHHVIEGRIIWVLVPRLRHYRRDRYPNGGRRRACQRDLIAVTRQGLKLTKEGRVPRGVGEVLDHDLDQVCHPARLHATEPGRKTDTFRRRCDTSRRRQANGWKIPRT